MPNPLPAGTHPLPYVAAGMVIRFHGRWPGDWTVLRDRPLVNRVEAVSGVGMRVAFDRSIVLCTASLAEPFTTSEDE